MWATLCECYFQKHVVPVSCVLVITPLDRSGWFRGIRDLDQNHVKWCIIDRDPPAGDQGFIRRAYSGATLLDAFVREHFTEESRFGKFAILRRATGSLP